MSADINCQNPLGAVGVFALVCGSETGVKGSEELL